MSSVSDLRRLVWEIQKPYNEEGKIFYNKMKFKKFIHDNNIRTPETYKFIIDIENIDDLNMKKIPDLFVIKPNCASRGSEVYILHKLSNGDFQEIDGRIHPIEFIKGKISFILQNKGCGGVIIEEAITNPAQFEVFLKGQKGIVDVRFYMLNDEILFAKARIPTNMSRGYSNTGRKAGALFVNSDGFIIPDEIFKNTSTKHPDYNIDYKGNRLPFWNEFKRVSVNVAKLFDIPFHSVDMTIDKNGVGTVIESEKIPLLSHFTDKGCEVVMDKIKELL